MYEKTNVNSPYLTNENGVDAFGVDHSDFSLRDELEYQAKMQNAEISTALYPRQYEFENWEGKYETESAWGNPHISSTPQYRQFDCPYNDNTKTNYILYGTDYNKEMIDKMLGDIVYQRALNEYAIPNEGEYVNNKNDAGGETKYGISKRYHPNEDIKNLTRERANAILYDEIWNWNGINKLPPEIVGFVFDHGIRTSPQNAVKTVHKVLGIPKDANIIGNLTLNKLKDMKMNSFLSQYKNEVLKQDKIRQDYKEFGNGWDNRTNRYHLSY